MDTDVVRAKLAVMPTDPGVYQLKDVNGKILYIGKAISLRNRVKSYFGSQRGFSVKTRALISNVADFDFVVTDTEVEALVLENNLIKRYKPRYNVVFRDDKQYLYIKVTVQESYPRVLTTRAATRDGSRYFGPYTSARSVRHIIKLLNRLFPFRTCALDMDRVWDRPCLKYHINLCNGPCIRVVEPAEYQEVIRDTISFLEGRHEAVLSKLECQMKLDASDLRFEAAATNRDRINAIRKVMTEQKIVDPRRGDQDVLGLAAEGREIIGHVLTIRDGKMIGGHAYRLKATGQETTEELTGEFVREYYGRAMDVPKKILLPAEVPDKDVVISLLSTLRGGKVHLLVPKRGAQRKLVSMANKNAQEALGVERAALLSSSRRLREALRQIGEGLRMESLPRRIECYDVSHTQGTSTVASMVVFEDGVAVKSKYRRFKIQNSSGNDDYASIYEVINRRFGRAKKSRAVGMERIESNYVDVSHVQLDGFDPAAPLPDFPDQSEGGVSSWAVLPDLVLIDGGKGQLRFAQDAMRDQGLEFVPIAAIAKSEEELFVPKDSNPIVLASNSSGLHLLQRIRDEAHRFAISFHTHLRTKAARQSVLDDIPGVGPKRKRSLIRHFGSVHKIREAEVKDIAGVKGISLELAGQIKAIIDG